jgi:hypothetical protein
MDEFAKLVGERTTLLDQAQALVDAGVTAGSLSEDDDKKITDLHNQAEALTAKINDLQAANDRAAKAQETQNKLKATRLNPLVNRIKAIGTNAPAMPSNAGNEPFKVPAKARRFEPTNFVQESVDGRDAAERAYRFGQWAMARATACLPAKYQFTNSIDFCREQGIFNVHGEGGSDVSNAGVFVPEEFMVDVIRLVERYGVARQIFRTVQMTSETLKRPRRVGGLTAYAVGENQAGTESDAEWSEVRLLARKFMVLTRMSKELSEDASISIANELLFEIALAFATREDNCCFNGDATSQYNGMSGIRTNLATLTAGTAPGLIAGAGSTWASLTLANFNSAVAALPQYAAAAAPRWICSRPFYFGVMEPLLQAANGAVSSIIQDGAGNPRFLGYPVTISQAFPTATASATIPVVLGDFQMSCMFGDRRMMEVEFSDSVTVGGQSVWERDQVAVKATERFDFVNHDFGTNSVAGPIVGIRTT